MTNENAPIKTDGNTQVQSKLLSKMLKKSPKKVFHMMKGIFSVVGAVSFSVTQFPCGRVIQQLQTQNGQCVKVERSQSIDFHGIKWEAKRTIEICPPPSSETAVKRDQTK